MPRPFFILGLGLLILQLGQPTRGVAQAGARAMARVVPITGAFPPLALTEVRRISESEIDAAKITLLTVSPNGTVILVDQKPLQIVAFPASGGRRPIGRIGSGPGEYQRVEALAWLHDTLVVLDTRLRRVSLFSLATGRALASFSYRTDSDPRVVVGLLDRGAGAVGVVSSRTGPARPLPIAGARGAPFPAFTFAPVSPLGLGLSMPGLLDSTEARAGGLDCEDKSGTIHILNSFWPDRGPIRAFAPNGDFVSSIPDSIDLLVRRRSDPTRPIRLVRAGGRLPISRAVWDSVANDYLEIVKNHGAVKCTGSTDRPTWLPMVRAIATDENDRIWIETTAANGGGELRAISTDGSAWGVTGLPRRDESVAWFLRSGKLYVVALDADDLPSVRVFAIESKGTLR